MNKLEISKVHDAYHRGGECPLCDLEASAEQVYLRSFEHSRVMEPSVRVQTNREGFCAEHLRKLYAGENRLGLGLVVHTRLQALRTELERAVDAASRRSGRREARRSARRGAERLAEQLHAASQGCFLCRLLASDLQRYAFTILYLWTFDAGFPPVFRASRGFCVPHFELVLREALRVMRPDRLSQWLDDAGPLLADGLRRLEQDLLAFTQLHRAENTSLGTDEQRSALARTLQKLAGGGGWGLDRTS